jgi:pimeloyl-ACP methyl ester carboxylesterase
MLKERTALICGAELIQIRGVGHMLHMERPEEFNKLTLEALHSTSRP